MHHSENIPPPVHIGYYGLEASTILQCPSQSPRIVHVFALSVNYPTLISIKFI